MKEGKAGVVLCFGEVLWDSLPRGLFPGGAPLNVAFHLRRLGLYPVLVSAVGQDRLGEEMLARLESWDLEAAGVSVLSDRETGLSRVTVVDGSPSFEILPAVAWDRIELSDEVLQAAGRGVAVVFGSLSQREEQNRTELLRLLDLSPTALRIFDVNLRPPFSPAKRVLNLARHAHVVKLNEIELATLLEEEIAPAGLEDAVRRFARLVNVDRICLTAGAAGAGLLTSEEWTWRSMSPAVVRDAVGAGDAFLGALLFGILRGESAEDVLRRAGGLARFVVTRDGATPDYRLDHDGHVVDGSTPP
ncbi:MAG: PfkB family carbohydrate kinase [Thermoanaerobaculia bacterium]